MSSPFSMLSFPPVSLLSQRLVTLAVAACFAYSPLFAAISAGGLAVVGFTDDNNGAGDTDDFVLVATEFIAAGEVIYFTNTGWSSLGGASTFYAVDMGTESGSQQLVRLTLTSSIAPGTLISSADTSNSAFSWTTSGSITGGGGSAEYSKLDLFGTLGIYELGDQIYIFQSADPLNPMDVPPSQLAFIYLMDNGEPEAAINGFENPSADFTGANYPDASTVAQGLSLLNHTAVELVNGTYPTGLHNGAFGLNMSADEIEDLQQFGGSKEDWLAAIANPDNWTSGALPTASLNILGVPEPSRIVLLMGAFGVVILRRRRAR